MDGEETPVRYWKDNVKELVNQQLLEFPNGVKRTYIYMHLPAGLCNICDECGHSCFEKLVRRHFLRKGLFFIFAKHFGQKKETAYNLRLTTLIRNIAVSTLKSKNPDCQGGSFKAPFPLNMETSLELKAHRTKENDHQNAGIKLHNCFLATKNSSIIINKVRLSHVTGQQ